ncbi:universal stress protein [Mongoliitalea daihaiensis]|uniref:universal stress protein n=1 Tax=Mongoliitalea daihaiensis TaxID=2782006 RepID=UPI001F24BFCC|nr:universal stress protein [Mongoliitalea daihaiensis]UJP63464.1 universal stress protein [Mongoliitalea daihaiensis]
MKTILVPYDFSTQAGFALNFATKLAEKTKNKLELLHVIELPTPTSFSSFGEAGGMSSETANIFMIELIDKRKKQMAELEETYKDAAFQFETKMVFGNPFAGIAKEIVDADADIVVMGSKGSSGIEEVLIGSNTEKVVRNAACPVLTIKSAILPDEIQQIVFASDFNEVPSNVVERLKASLAVIDATLHLVKINTPSMFEHSRVSTQKMEAFTKEFNLQVSSMKIYNAPSEEEGIVDYADDIKADMIAMATTGRTGFLHLLTGSIAEDVVNSAIRPVWTMKAKK